jgi:hypothetical protein
MWMRPCRLPVVWNWLSTVFKVDVVWGARLWGSLKLLHLIWVDILHLMANTEGFGWVTAGLNGLVIWYRDCNCNGRLHCTTSTRT